MGSALSFDGVDDYVDCGVGSSLDVADGLTIAAWVKRPDFDTHGVIAGKTNGDLVTAGYGLYSYEEGVAFNFYASGNWRRTVPRIPISADEWHYVVGAFDGTSSYVYIDGEEMASLEYAGTITTADGYPFQIGFWRLDNPECFKGLMDDVRVYNRSLSSEEIRQLYYESFSDYERAVMRVENALGEKVVALEAVDAALVEEADAYEALEELLDSRDYGDLKKGDIVKAKQEIHSAMQHQEQSADALEKGIGKLEDALLSLGWEPEPNEPEPDPNLVAHWKFDEGSGTMAYDSAGGSHGMLVNGPVWTSGQVGGALEFAGGPYGAYVDAGDMPALDITGEQVTVMAWFKPTSSDGAVNINAQIVSKWLGTNSAYTLGYDYRGETNTIMFVVYTGTNGVAYGSIAVDDTSKWYHLSGVYDGSEVIVYIDGLAGTPVSHTGNIYNSSMPLRISGYANGHRTVDGTIDDVRVYDRALSAAEVQHVYQDGL